MLYQTRNYEKRKNIDKSILEMEIIIQPTLLERKRFRKHSVEIFCKTVRI